MNVREQRVEKLRYDLTQGAKGKEINYRLSIQQLQDTFELAVLGHVGCFTIDEILTSLVLEGFDIENSRGKVFANLSNAYIDDLFTRVRSLGSARPKTETV